MSDEKTTTSSPPYRKVRGLDEITKGVLNALAARHPRKSIHLTHQFLDGTAGNPCGFVPNDFDGTAIFVSGQWY